MRKFILLIFIILLPVIFTGCTQIARSRTEIDEALFIRVLSIDKGENDNVKVTITARNTTVQSSDSNSGVSEEPYSNSSEGKTVMEAVRKFWSYAGRRPYYAHTEYILISEDIAKEGILKYIDFISRDHQFRHNARIYIVKGSSASSLVQNVASSHLFIAERLANLENNIVGQSISSKVSIAEAMFIFDNPNVSTFLPCIELINTNKQANNGRDKYDIALTGYAIFKGDKLDSYLLGNESRAVNWVKNRVSSGVILVKGNKGEDISLEIINNHTRIKPQITDNKINCTIYVDVNTNIDEITAPDDIFNRESIAYLVDQQEKIIRNEIKNVLSIAQKKNLDFFGIIQEFHMQYPVLWKDIEKNWPEIFPQINFNVVVHSKINRTYLIKEPTGSNIK